MITKGQWNDYVDMLHNIMDQKTIVRPKIMIHGGDVLRIENGRIYCASNDRTIHVVFSHPESINNDKKVRELYNATRIVYDFNLEEVRRAEVS